MPVLVLIRHAKTEAHAESDHSRNLTDRGHAQAATLGPLLGGLGDDAMVLVSSANRAEQTWEEIDEGLAGEPHDVLVLDDLYTFDGAELLARIRKHAKLDVVIVVGHNPAVSELAAMLTGAHPPDDPALAVGGDLRTGRGVILDYDGRWKHLDAGTCTARDWLIPAVD